MVQHSNPRYAMYCPYFDHIFLEKSNKIIDISHWGKIFIHKGKKTLKKGQEKIEDSKKVHTHFVT